MRCKIPWYLVAITSAFLPSSAFAGYGSNQIPLTTQAALAQAEAAAQAPWIYGTAIVLAGVAIAVGIYLAARFRGKAD